MLICIDFDGVVVRTDRPFADTTTPLQFMPGAKEGLIALKQAGHTLVLFSARTNRSLLYTPEWDPLVRAGVRRPHAAAWSEGKAVHWARYHQMRNFCATHLADVFDAIDDGLQGKPLADLFIDDRALSMESGWPNIAMLYGATPQAHEDAHG